MPEPEVQVHVCDSCCHAQGHRPKVPADSRGESWMCAVCGHYGIGSSYLCTKGDWDRLRIVPENAARLEALAREIQTTPIAPRARFG